MAAPLYSRYKRHADREAARFPKKSTIRSLVPLWRRPDTWVYSLSARASHQAGWWSTSEPGELLRALSVQFMPADRVWIEVDWKALLNGAAHLPLDGSGVPSDPGALKTPDHSVDQVPIRVGMMLAKALPGQVPVAPMLDQDVIYGLLTYLYPNGALFIGPYCAYWSLGDVVVNERMDHPDALIANAPIGRPYRDLYQAKHPRLHKQVLKRMGLTVMGEEQVGLVKARSLLSNGEGTTRLMVAALTSCLAAKRAKPGEPGADIATVEANPRQANRHTIEVDLFLRESKEPGKALRRSVGHLEGIKKGLHMVEAHYAYRARKDGADPKVCPVSQFGYHDWESIEGTHSEVCALCGQRRWFKDKHKRGDEAYGIVGQKVRNVRLG